VERYVDAWEPQRCRRDGGVLAEDATVTMPPAATWYTGRHAVAAFLKRRPLSGRQAWRLVPTRANGQLAFGHYMRDDRSGGFVAHHVTVLTLRGDQVTELAAFPHTRDPSTVRSARRARAVTGAIRPTARASAFRASAGVISCATAAERLI